MQKTTSQASAACAGIEDTSAPASTIGATILCFTTYPLLKWHY
ncbi:hypothetical protein PPGU16_84230 (plasmid) [Paraburkholderia largidicola]|uniref:Uncharacterized protein n=1 Tax=Paraburkholderia largidicola TaxID=3014751 RepID=A0A7I8C2P0_9BURK|nr:hypothetical protein PPGU16_84230 [Paraburkholderia sp. PGU16]